MRDPNRGHHALRVGRASIPHSEYFLTLCTAERKAGLTEAAVATAVLREAQAMESDATWRLRCAVVMPDHVHALIVLGARLSLGKSVARLKAKTSAILSAFDSKLTWERGFFDHHVRPDEDRLSLFLYLFLNPYRANSCARTERWPWFLCSGDDWAWFKDYLDADLPVPEWLR